jgi:hypothetical protein
MNKIKNFLKANYTKVAVGSLALTLAAQGMAAKAADFDATDTTGIITTALGNVSPTLKTGIIAILVIALGIWAIFFVVGKLRKHVR